MRNQIRSSRPAHATAAGANGRSVRRGGAPSRKVWMSSASLKMVMAVSGLVFVAFVIGHMYGNLKAFSGHEAYNAYAEHLRVLGEPLLPREGFLWLMRAGLMVALVAHVACAAVLWRRAARARTVPYTARLVTRSSIASRTMRPGGVALFLFLVWHLINFTIGKVNARGGPTNDPYVLLVDTFSIWWSTLLYLIVMVILGLHLWHGTWSAAQSLGMTSTRQRRGVAQLAAATTALVVAGGFSLSPIFILAGVIDY